MAGLPPGPSEGRLAQTVAFHRDPLATLRRHRARFGDAFTVRLATTGPFVVLASAEAAAVVPELDPGAAHAGAARRRMLPMASPRSVFGGDDGAHDAARGRVAGAFAPEAIADRRDAIAAIARRHVARWPRGRPFRLLPRMRALADEVFVREVLGIDGERATALAEAIGGVMWTPGNPPVTIPGPRDGLLGRLVDVEFRRRRGRVAALLAADDSEVDELLALLMAAQEPMAAALTWLVLRVAAAPELAARVADEGLDEPFGAAVLTEALRLHPAAVGVLRELTEPLTVAGHTLPAGAVAMVPIPLVQRDPDAWPDPDAFRPERHGDGDPDGPLLPFGGGARGCLGRWLARTELAVIAPLVLRELRPRPLGPQPERMVLRGTILVPRRSGLVVADEPASA